MATTRGKIMEDPVMKVLNDTRCKECKHYAYVCICQIIDDYNHPERSKRLGEVREWLDPTICQPINDSIVEVLGNATYCCDEDMEEEQIHKCIFIRKLSSWKPDLSWYEFSEIFEVIEEEPRRHMEIVKQWKPFKEIHQGECGTLEIL